ncbi:hypothetical protein Pme01_59850 [Planosporangium mesophilum]|uniref:NlpC/P60 domain-containing protein n=2 Tax=Planosporangium mesophilum TaxID=689768 RepID=A0A8J3X767_9ACTN|nr:hypothetical protein Pme01_59850 [Planosporangium mesophilum]
MTASIALETAGQQLRKLDEDLTEARRTADATKDTWTKASKEVSGLRDRVGHEAGEAYKAATAMGPLDGLAADLHRLSVLAPGIRERPGGQATARDVERAEQVERAANTAYLAALAKADELSRQRDTVKADFDKNTATLTDLRTRNSVAYQRELAAIDAQQAALGAGMNVGGAVNGWMAGPVALRAVAYARSKLGRPYVWGAEGPDYFDCSGLVLWAYQQASGNPNIFPRVANDQYYATRSREVQVDELLPGDLLFFATDRSDWRSVHHVGMYLGNGYMIHAPTTGDVVKISPIWWSEFYRATRVDTPAKTPSPPPAPPATTPPATTPPATTPPSTPPPSTPPTTPPGWPPSERPPAPRPTKPSPSPSPSPSASSASASPSTSPSAKASGSAAASSPPKSAPATPKP